MHVADNDDAAGAQLLGGEGGVDDGGKRVACHRMRTTQRHGQPGTPGWSAGIVEAAPEPDPTQVWNQARNLNQVTAVLDIIDKIMLALQERRSNHGSVNQRSQGKSLNS